MSMLKMSGLLAALALAGMLPVPQTATALDVQEYVNIQSQCQHEAQDYGVAPEQIKEYVSGCVLSYGGMPVAAPEAPAADAGANLPAADEQQAGDTGEQDTGAAVE